MSESAWSHWHAETIRGHAEELALIEEWMPGATMAESCTSHGRAAVVAYEDGRLLVATVEGGPVWSNGTLEVGVKRDVRGEAWGSAEMRAGSLAADHVPVPFALAVRAFVEAGAR